MSMYLTLPQLFDRFFDDAAAERWFVRKRGPDGVRWPSCESDNMQTHPTRKPPGFLG